MSIVYGQNDRQPPMRYILERGGAPINVSTATITFRAYRKDHEAYEPPLFSGAATFTSDGTDGDVQYALQEGDLAVSGRLSGQYVIDWGGGEEETVPDDGFIDITVRPAAT